MNQPDAQTAQNYVTCPCQHCSGHIEFDSSGFQKGETRTVECPFCKLETIIFLPVQSVVSKPTTITAPSLKPNPPATKPSSSQNDLFSIKISSRAAAVFFAFTTFCLASILVWEHLANHSQPVSAVKAAPASTVGQGSQPVSAIKVAPASTVGQGSQPVSGDKISGSDTITVGLMPNVNRVRLDEVTFENEPEGFYVRLKSNGTFLGMLPSSDPNADKIRAYLRGN